MPLYAWSGGELFPVIDFRSHTPENVGDTPIDVFSPEVENYLLCAKAFVNARAALIKKVGCDEYDSVIVVLLEEISKIEKERRQNESNKT